MANVIKHKRGSGSDPAANNLVLGELAIRTDTGKLFTKMDSGAIAEIAGGGSDIAINTLSSSSATGGGSATFNGSAYRFTLSAPPSVSAQQLLVSINGVIQKPVAGTGQPSEGFSVDGTDIILGAAPATGSDFFILTFKSLGVSEPADNSVTSAKIVDGAIVNADINASAAIAGSKISPSFNTDVTITDSTPRLTLVDSDNSLASFLDGGSGNLFINSHNANRDVIITSDNLSNEIARFTGDGKVGIGTTSPTSLLHVNSGTTNTCATFQSTDSGAVINLTDNSARSSIEQNGTDLKIVSDTDAGDADSTIKFQVDASTKMTILSSGNVGIGTTSPVRNLHIKDTSPRIMLSNDNTGHASGDGTELMLDTGGNFEILQRENLNLEFFTNNLQRMTINGSGNVGIGTVSPSSLLELRQSSASHQIVSINRANSNTAALYLGNDSSNNALISSNNTNLLFGKDDSNTFTEYMRLDSSGHILFTGGSSQRVAFGTTDNTKYAGFGEHHGAAQDVGLNFFTTTNAGTTFVNHFRIDHNGNLLGTDTNGISSISDSRVKTDITDYTYDVEKFKQFAPKQFNWKNPKYHGEKTNVKGFLAQDLEAIDTQWVGSSFIEKDHPDYDLVDKSKNGQNEDVGVAKTSKFGGKDAMYISVINQLIARVEALEAK